MDRHAFVRRLATSLEDHHHSVQLISIEKFPFSNFTPPQTFHIIFPIFTDISRKIWDLFFLCVDRSYPSFIFWMMIECPNTFYFFNLLLLRLYEWETNEKDLWNIISSFARFFKTLQVVSRLLWPEE
jgi:hypothetical protein